jgi:hypothetical protein
MRASIIVVMILQLCTLVLLIGVARWNQILIAALYDRLDVRLFNISQSQRRDRPSEQA